MNSPKVIHSAGRFPWAVGVTGNVRPEIIHAEIGAANPITLKQLVRRLPDAMRAAINQTAREADVAPSAVDLALIGVAWDFAAKRPSGFVIQSRPGIVLPDAEAFVWYDTAWNIAGGELGDAAAQLGRACDPSDTASFDPERDGLARSSASGAAASRPPHPA